MMREHDILLGKSHDGAYLKFGGSEHVALHARSGAGKTSSFTIPACFTWRGSLVVLDIKRGALPPLRDTGSGRGKRCIFLILLHRTEDRIAGIHSRRCSVRSQSGSSQIARMGFQLFPEQYAGPGNASADRFWEPAGRSAFVAVATLLAETSGEPLTMSNVLRVFTRGDGLEWLARKISERRPTTDPYSRVVADGISDYINGDIGRVDENRKTVTTRLQIWHNPRIASATAVATSTSAICVASR